MKNAKVLIYNDEDMNYITGYLNSYEEKIDYMDVTGIADVCKKVIPTAKEITLTTIYTEELQNIELDETTMKRIAKFNKEVECQKLDEKIKEKQKKIDKLDDILEDKSKRVNKIKKYIADIYNIDINDDEDYDYYD